MSFLVVPWRFWRGRFWPTIRPVASWLAVIIPRAEAAIPGTSEGDLQASVERTRPRWTDRTRVREWRAAIGEIGNRAGVEECSVGRIAIVENIVGTRVDLECLVDLIRSMEVENRIGRQPRRLIGFVAD